MTEAWLDLKQAVRLFRREPRTVAVIVGSLTLGIGANTAVFSFVNAILFKSLPVEDEATLVDLSEWSATELCAGCGVGTSFPTFREWKARATSFSTMAAHKETSITVSGEGEPQRVGAALVTPDARNRAGPWTRPAARGRAAGRVARRRQRHAVPHAPGRT